MNVDDLEKKCAVRVDRTQADARTFYRRILSKLGGDGCKWVVFGFSATRPGVSFRKATKQGFESAQRAETRRADRN